jgi:hypothetical protein
VGGFLWNFSQSYLEEVFPRLKSLLKPHITPAAWTNYSYTVRTGPDVSGGITLKLKSSCGPVNGCLVNVFF